MVQYTAALQDFVEGGGEAALSRAYELARKALAEGMGLMEMATVYQNAIESVLVGNLTHEELARRLKAAGECFRETLTPFEMTHRGVRWAHNMLVQMNEELREINAKLEAYGYSVSHDLRAPLRHMRGFAQALLEDYAERLDSLGREYASRIVTAAERMDQLIQDLMDYSRFGRAHLELKPVSLGSVVSDLLDQMEGELRKREAQVIVERPLRDVLGHRIALEQVMINLLRNAVKFVPANVKPEVRIMAEEREGWIRLWIKDNGIGISPEHTEHIFEVFQRVPDSETYPGTGIGLAIVSMAVARMGGHVGVDSVRGKGSAFWIELKKARDNHDQPS